MFTPRSQIRSTRWISRIGICLIWIVPEGSARLPAMDESAAYLLLEPILGEQVDGLPVTRPLDADDPRYLAVVEVLEAPFGRWVLEVGARARELALKRSEDQASARLRLDHPAYFVILPQGNRPKQGLAIRTETGTQSFPESWYVEIDHQRADTLVPHEYGHVMMFESLPGDMPPHPPLLPHTTAAITNDVTAFSEGFGIHFETLAGDFADNQRLYREVHRDAFPLDEPPKMGDSLLPARDLMTYSQSYRRYTAVKENSFACLPRPAPRFAAGAIPDGNDVLARWTDSTSDPASVKTLEQMVASEGVIAALFYRLATAPAGSAGDGPRLPDPARYAAFFAAFAELTEERARQTPLALIFLEHLLEQAEETERRRLARIAQEVFHYTLTLDGAPERYASVHEAGHRVDQSAYRRRINELNQEMLAALELLIEDPSAPALRVAPELWIRNDRIQIDLAVLGLSGAPLVLDLNTAPITLLMTLPAVDFEIASAIVAHRGRLGGFRSIEQLGEVRQVGPAILAEVVRMHTDCLTLLEER